ncbi:hypothetical protein PG988_006063 [Apiospora saccharicola]
MRVRRQVPPRPVGPELLVGPARHGLLAGLHQRVQRRIADGFPVFFPGRAASRLDEQDAAVAEEPADGFQALFHAHRGRDVLDRFEPRLEGGQDLFGDQGAEPAVAVVVVVAIAEAAAQPTSERGKGRRLPLLKHGGGLGHARRSGGARVRLGSAEGVPGGGGVFEAAALGGDVGHGGHADGRFVVVIIVDIVVDGAAGRWYGESGAGAAGGGGFDAVAAG